VDALALPNQHVAISAWHKHYHAKLGPIGAQVTFFKACYHEQDNSIYRKYHMVGKTHNGVSSDRPIS
jgi:hypothetical protein